MKKLNGYRASHRNKWLLIKYGVLSVQEFALLELYIDMSDFDKRHEKYGQLEIYFEEITLIFGKAENTIRSWHNTLLKKGFIQKTDRMHWFRIFDPAKHIVGGVPWCGEAHDFATKEKDKSIKEIFPFLELDNQDFEEKLQLIEEKEASLSTNSDFTLLGSSKVESNVDMEYEVDVRQKLSDQEYKEIAYGNNYQYLSEEDMKWIDQEIIFRVTREEFVASNTLEKVK